MYTVSYFNEAQAQWNPTGCFPFSDIEDARKYMRKLSKDCNRCVSFKIIQLPG